MPAQTIIVISAISTETVRLPLMISTRTYSVAVLVVMVGLNVAFF